MDDEHADDSAPEVEAGSEIEKESFPDVNEDLDDVRDDLTEDEADQDATEPSEVDEDHGDTL